MGEEVVLGYDEMLDRVEVEMHKIGATPFETAGIFTPGLYLRALVIPQGSYLTSKVHKIEHPFILAEGKMTIFTEDGGEQILTAPYIDITKAGTRRFARAEENSLWITCHASDKTTEADVENEVIEERENKLLTEYLTNIKIN